MSDRSCTPDCIADLDPPLPDDNYLPIPAPEPLPKLIYHRRGWDVLSIQSAMELEDRQEEFAYLMYLIRYTAKRYTDISIPFVMQSKALISKIKKEVLDRAPVFYNYEDAWPVTVYLRLAMKTGRRSDSTTPVELSDSDPDDRESEYDIGSVGGGNEASLSGEDEEAVLKKAPVSPQLRLTLLCGVNPMEPYAGVRATQPAETTSLSPTSPPRSIVALLQSHSLPTPDAVRITGVLASLGISDPAYLVVLARMASRDAWLAELREKGRLTEIQRRREDRAMAENGGEHVWIEREATISGVCRNLGPQCCVQMEPPSSGLIPRPKRWPSILYQGAASGRSSLQAQMGLENDKPKFIQLLALIRRIAVGYVNMHVPYGKQDKRQLEKIKTQTSVSGVILGQVLFHSSTLRNRRRTNTTNAEPALRATSRAPSSCGASNVPVALSNLFGRIITPAGRNKGGRLPTVIHLLARPSSSDDEDTPLAALRKRKARGGDSARLQPEGLESRPPRIKIPATKREPAVSRASTEEIVQLDALSRAPTPVPASMDFATMLRARFLPEADATRIAELFSSFGVSDGAYMRVFARMASRDAWLRELRERGQLSEIQMLVPERCERLGTASLVHKAQSGHLGVEMDTPSSGPMPKPKRSPSVIYGRTATTGPSSLQVQMGLENDTPRFAQILALIRCIAAEYIDSGIPYGKQDKRVLEKVKEKVLYHSSFLRNQYAGGWPVEAYLSRACKNHGYKSTVKTRCVSERKRRCREDPPYRQYTPPILSEVDVIQSHKLPRYDQQSVQPRHESGWNQDDSGAAELRSSPRESEFDLPQSASSDEEEEPSAPPARRALRVGSHTAGLHSTELELRPPATNGPATASELASSRITTKEIARPDDMPRPPTTPVPASLDFASLLRARFLPESDATRIADLFASFGVSDGAYMRVFARMASRDAWLRELSQRGQLSEIQMFVVRDVLETVKAQA
ncbi:hypothetical protein OH77DRAFT_1435346 [Trametes cingulata]|nr:hypothetical protein OH77DRAFT_1435346 [Trametes cingulata]